MRDLHDYETETLGDKLRDKNAQPMHEKLVKEMAAHVKQQMANAAYHSNPHEHIARWLLADVIPLKDEHVAEGAIDSQTRIQAAQDEAKRWKRACDQLERERDYYRDRFNRILEDVRDLERERDQEYVTWDSPTQPS